ncbi:MAG: WYL domain-containing protein [Clostridia bacterium]|nr:WYL domain-containing protein [Clostridia bacterium]
MENEGKLRLLYIAKLLFERTNEDHPLSTAQLMSALKDEYGITSHRTTVTSDIEALQAFGLDICKIESTQNKYFIANREFQLPEVKLLMDSVRATGAITLSKSEALIEKLSRLCDCYSARALLSGLPDADEIKPANEMILYIIDAINTAIAEQKKISFRYFSYDENMSPELKNGGHPYLISPYALVQDGDRYYTVGYCEKHKDITVFRVDRIAEVPTVKNTRAEKKPVGFNVSDYIRTSFRMFFGETAEVTLLCESSMMNTVVDHFGRSISVRDAENGWFEATVSVMPSPVFYRWIFGAEGKIKIVSPDYVREEYANAVRKAYESL